METNTLLSIIIPAYNIKEYLPRCVESVCRQTYRNLEIILVDDGSTDGTGELCDRLAEKDQRISVIHKENGGSSSARNEGIKAAKGSYFGFVDSDDYIMPEMYALLLEAIRMSGSRMAQAARREIGENGEELPPICIPPDKDTVYSSADFLKELLLHKGDCSFCTKLTDSTLFRTHLFPEGILNEDFYLLVHLLPETKGIVSIPSQMYHVFYRTGSNTRKQSKEEFPRVFADCVDNADMVYSMVCKTYPELKDAALRFGLFQRLEYLLHIPISGMNGGNTQYKEIVSYIRAHRMDTIRSVYLTKKNKIYLLLFSVAPRGLRRFHKRLKGI